MDNLSLRKIIKTIPGLSFCQVKELQGKISAKGQKKICNVGEPKIAEELYKEIPEPK